MTKKQLIESAVTKIVNRVLNEAEDDAMPSFVKKFQQLSGISPTKTTSKSYPYEFAIGKRYTLIVSKTGQFLLVFAGDHDFIWGKPSASAAYKQLVASNDL